MGCSIVMQVWLAMGGWEGLVEKGRESGDEKVGWERNGLADCLVEGDAYGKSLEFQVGRSAKLHALDCKKVKRQKVDLFR